MFRSGALGAGASLWILPELSHCRWAQKIDWYLNLQLSKSNLHPSPVLSDEVKSILMENEWEVPEVLSYKDSPLLVASLNQLPNQQVIRLPLGTTLREWIVQIKETWQRLEQPVLRVFLADSHNKEEFIHIWEEIYQGPHEITIVPPLEQSEK